ncbi:MAG: hypothetical protein WDZ93_01945 [Candidatus Paceibacterota bacterium]
MINLNQKDIISAADTTKRLVQDEEYYRYIFKKTEKIVSVVFYILYNLPTDTKTEVHIADIQRTAQQVHDAILKSLETRIMHAEDAVRTAALALIALESKLRVAHTAGAVSSDLLHVLSAEVDSVLRGMNKYMHQSDAPDVLDETATALQFNAPKRRERPVAPRQRSEPREETDTLDRRERIKTVLQAKGTASIKDISDIITDCSEKTIQRELNAMIEDKVVQRQGERRWSVYTLA